MDLDQSRRDFIKAAGVAAAAAAAPLAAAQTTPSQTSAGLSNVLRVALIRVGSVTHSFNSDQRYVGVRFEQVTSDRLRIFAPPDAGIAGRPGLPGGEQSRIDA